MHMMVNFLKHGTNIMKGWKMEGNTNNVRFATIFIKGKERIVSVDRILSMDKGAELLPSTGKHNFKNFMPLLEKFGHKPLVAYVATASANYDGTPTANARMMGLIDATTRNPGFKESWLNHKDLPETTYRMMSKVLRAPTVANSASASAANKGFGEITKHLASKFEPTLEGMEKALALADDIAERIRKECRP